MTTIAPADFSSRLEEFICAYSSKGKGDIAIEITPMQADPCIAEMVLVACNVDIIIFRVSDFANVCWSSGCRGLADIMLKDMKLSTKNELT